MIGGSTSLNSAMYVFVLPWKIWRGRRRRKKGKEDNEKPEGPRSVMVTLDAIGEKIHRTRENSFRDVFK